MSDLEGLSLLDLPELTTDRLADLLRGWLGAYSEGSLPDQELDKRLAQWGTTLDTFIPQMWPLFAGRLDAALKERGLKPGVRLVWMPSGALGILPLGAAMEPVSKRRLADAYEIVYALSLDALVSAQEQIARPTAATLAAVGRSRGTGSAAVGLLASMASHCETRRGLTSSSQIAQMRLRVSGARRSNSLLEMVASWRSSGLDADQALEVELDCEGGDNNLRVAYRRHLRR